MNLDLAGGSRIPTIHERRARSVADLRAAGIGVSRVLMVHDGSSAASDLFQSLLTMLDPEVALDVLQLPEADGTERTISDDLAQAQLLGRVSRLLHAAEIGAESLVQTVLTGKYGAVVLGTSPSSPAGERRGGAGLDRAPPAAHRLPGPAGAGVACAADR